MADPQKSKLQLELGAKSNGFERKGQAWYIFLPAASDTVVEVDAMSFHLHKFALSSRSGLLARLIEEELSTGEDETCRVILTDVPGGAEAFELAAKFCYGMKLEITALNVAVVYCVAHYLEMTEDYGQGNLLARSQGFLNQTIFKDLHSSVQGLKGCHPVMQQALDLQIVKKCLDSITMKVYTDPKLVGWPINLDIQMGEQEGGLRSPGGSILWNGISTGARIKYQNPNSNSEWWMQDICELSFPLFKLVISAMVEKGIRSEAITGAVVHYAKLHIPGLTKRKIADDEDEDGSTKQKMMLESMEDLLPFEKNSALPTKFLFALLKTALILNASKNCINGIERRIGMRLDEATVDDLLIPNYSYRVETLYDVDCVQRILQHFMHFGDYATEAEAELFQHGLAGAEDTAFVSSPSLSPLAKVCKLLDSFLAEIASDINLKPEKFQSLAQSVPNYARLYDDGLYRATDLFLQAHPWMSDAEREKLCNVINWQKLTLEACTHAAQNERLPLRVVVQVLFFEQLQLRNAIAGSFIAADVDPSHINNRMSDFGNGNGNYGNLRMKENGSLRIDLDTIKTKVNNLEKECYAMRQLLQKMKTPKHSSGLTSLASNFVSKIGCKFKPQVHESQPQYEYDSRTIVSGHRLERQAEADAELCKRRNSRARHRRSTSLI